ncbi:RagB/SusD family nutrient uptake outer membrane protein [Hymenobacter sp. BT175]|uniref:RagB/SusD family nutrient uptake outer membrane protein n=1 Tax=Hymenobacter translucens TaxID=2886507 RepID=UPI001D0EE3BD|nr:RagB/SusD family nutrient uptake outer membrane protein [Hymenobacter translucens]MCC2547003.1 RagB/SusD family nutrient uptake outer membrane protein [Hymenobacter translucens]
MHKIIFPYQKTLAAGALALLLGTSSCSFFETEAVTDPNNISIESVLQNANQSQINALAVGLEASLRLGHVSNAPNNQVVGTFGREVVVMAGTESRWYTELLGTRSATLDDAAYYNAAYSDFARVRRAAQIFRESAQNAQILTAPQKAGAAGFARTYEALSKLHILILQGGEGSTDPNAGGIRINLDDIRKPGKFVSYAEALTHLRQLLDQAAGELDQAGSTFAFPLSSGYANFNTPADFKKFNRALAARVALYQKDYAGTLTALGQSFYSRTAALTLGPKITFDPGAANNSGNPYFQLSNSNAATVVTVPDNFQAEAETGDTRLNKVALRTTPRRVGTGPTAVDGNYEPRVFASQTTPLDIIRNEELLLIAAEARAMTNDYAGATLDINVVRTAAGLAPTVLTSANALDVILKERRYSLFYEGHRWHDLRRTGRLRTEVTPAGVVGVVKPQTLMYSATPFRLYTRMERPVAEKQWDIANP